MEHTRWLDKGARSTFMAPFAMEGVKRVEEPAPARGQTNREVQPTTHFLAWQIALRLINVENPVLLTTSGAHIQTPPCSGQSRFYDPSKDPALQAFLERARRVARSIPPSPYEDTRWALEALLDPRTAHAAWPTPEGIIELEIDQIEKLLDQVRTGKNLHRRALELVTRYKIAPMFARQVTEQIAEALETGDTSDKARRRMLADMALGKVIEEAHADPRAQIAAMGQQAKLHGIQQKERIGLDEVGENLGKLLMDTIISTAGEISDTVIDVTPTKIETQPGPQT